MEQKNKPKNHWTQKNVDTACKKINNEVYGRNRQAPLHIKLDDLAVYINEKITRRGIAKGMVTIQEDLNNNILKAEKQTLEALMTNNKEMQYKYLTPIIFENNPALNCRYKCNEKIRNKVPERRKMKSDSNYGMAIGNLTAQAASNLNLCDFDNYIVNKLNFKMYVRYVDDIVIISNKKEKLIEVLLIIIEKLKETHQNISTKKTKISTAYIGVPFLEKVSYPYGYQKPSKQVIIRTYQKAKNIEYENVNSLLAKINSQIGTLKNYNCRKLIINYSNLLLKDNKQIICKSVC